MRNRLQRMVMATLFVLAASGCAAGGGEPITPPPPPPPAPPPPAPPQVTRLELYGEAVLTLDRGMTHTLGVRYRDEFDAIVIPAAPSHQWNTSDPDVVSVSASGVLVTGSRLGKAVVRVTAPGLASDSIVIWNQKPWGEPSAFRITLIYAADVPQELRDALAAAAVIWEGVIRDELPPAQLVWGQSACPISSAVIPGPPPEGGYRGVLIHVRASDGFPPDTYVEAVGGPCLQRPLPAPTTVLGQIVFNLDKVASEIPIDRMKYLALHEMGHALGLVAVVQGIPGDWYSPTTGAYWGALGLEGYRRDTGTRPSYAFYTQHGGHWLSPILDVMGRQVTTISNLTVGALMDMGYPAAWYGARTFGPPQQS